MEELSQQENKRLMWGSISNLVDKINDICNSIDEGWTEVYDVVADCLDDASNNKDTFSIFIDTFNFLYKLYWRLKEHPHKGPFNTVAKGDNSYIIGNYDYVTYKWGRELGVEIKNNRSFAISFDKLTDKQCLLLDHKIKGRNNDEEK